MRNFKVRQFTIGQKVLCIRNTPTLKKGAHYTIQAFKERLFETALGQVFVDTRIVLTEFPKTNYNSKLFEGVA